MDLSEIYDIRVENETQIIVCKKCKTQSEKCRHVKIGKKSKN